MNIGKRTLGVTLAAVLGAGVAGTALAAPPPWAPAHGYRAATTYTYVYYPYRQVYYAPDRNLWFWLDGGDWRFGVSLPGHYQPYTHGGVHVHLRGRDPSRHHRHVKKKYPRHYRQARHVHHHHHHHHASGRRHDDRRRVDRRRW